MPESPEILIAGSGPAGSATAIGLARLGFSVCVVASGRKFAACEGISERTVEGLENAGIRHALRTIGAPSPRFAIWNNQHSEANTERLVKREAFDRALLLDLQDAGVNLIHGRLTRIDHGADALCLHGETASGVPFHRRADYFVDARGRGATGGRQARMRGPATVSLLQQWQAAPGSARSAAASWPQGWAWLARCRDGSRFTQITVAAERLPAKPQLAEFFHQRLRQIPAAVPFCENASAVSAVVARSSTAILSDEPIADRSIKVGDAAMAVDPLSGNGVFQSLSTALLAPRVINTVLRQPDRASLAEQFYRERVHHAFMRFARSGRDFYRAESRWPEQPFWRVRRDWPDGHAAHEPAAPQQLTIAKRPVVAGDLINTADVVITPDQPLGIWHLHGIELAPLVRLVHEWRSTGKALHTATEQTLFMQQFRAQHQPGADPRQLRTLQSWLQRQQLIDRAVD